VKISRQDIIDIMQFSKPPEFIEKFLQLIEERSLDEKIEKANLEVELAECRKKLFAISSRRNE
jgi:hypothetical protein